MAKRNNAGPGPAATAPESAERKQLSLLGDALTKYGVTSSVVGQETPVLRVAGPDSDYAIEDVGCERRENGHAFLASFGVHLGSSDSIPMTAKKVAWLVGATDA